MNKKTTLRHSLLALFAGAYAAATATAGQAFDAASATALIDKHADAIVEVHLVNLISARLAEGPEEVAEMIAQSPPTEQETRASGVVLDPAGLVAVPALPLNPTMLIREVGISTPVGDIKVAFESRLADVRIITADGIEHAAEVILADGDTGLMLVKAVAKPEPGLGALTPDASQPHPSPFAPVLCLGRMPTAFGNQPTVTADRTTGLHAAGHGLDSLAKAASNVLGNAIFDRAGAFLGIAVIPVAGGASNPSLSDIQLHLLPASTIHRLAKEHLN